MNKFNVRDAFFTVGLGMVSTGVGFYDWRIGLIVCGAVLMLSSIVSFLTRSQRVE